MTQPSWTAVDHYFESAVGGIDDPVLHAALTAAQGAGLPEIQVSPLQGKLLHVLARSIGARRILEFGTLGGYSTIWLARALPADGRLITLEYAPKHAEVARANLAAAGLSDRVEVRVGAALDLLPALADADPFDFVFIDADKVNTAPYFAWAVEHTRPGALIFVDNVARKGEVIDPHGDENVQGMRRFFAALAAEPRVSASAVQTVGSKGYDGYVLAVRL